MNTLNTEISKLLGKAATTPISMSGLQSMLDELKAKGTIVTFDFSSLPVQYNDSDIQLNIDKVISSKTRIVGQLQCLNRGATDNPPVPIDSKGYVDIKAYYRDEVYGRLYTSNGKLRLFTSTNGSGSTYRGKIYIFDE